jgi:thiamine-phosphate pyrophosphorylase
VSLPAKFPRTPILCYVTDRKSLGSQGVGDNRTELLHCIVAAAGAGVDWIQIREKDLSGKEISLLVRDSLTLAKSSNPPNGQCTRILVNDRLDVAFAEQAGGVHLGENSLPLRNVSTWLGSPSKRPALLDFLVGVSCHSVENALDAARHGADYVFFGPVFATPSKTAFGGPQGLDRLREVCSAMTLPVLAIGGITRENAPLCLEAGAAGIAAIRFFQDSGDQPSELKLLKALRKDHRSPGP